MDGNYIPVPDAFVDIGLGKIKEIKDLDEIDDIFDKVIEQIKEKLSIQNDEDLQKVYVDIVCENGNRAYMIVKDNKTAASYAVFVKDRNGFYLPPDSDGELVLLPVKTVLEDGKELIGFDVKGDLLIPPTFTYLPDTGKLTYIDPKTGEKIVLTKETNTAPKMLAMFAMKNDSVIEQVFTPGKVPTPEQLLTPKQQTIFDGIRKNLELGGYSSDASLFEVSFNADDKPVITDRVSGRAISVDLKWNYLDPDNISGKDQLEDGSWVFNPNLMKRLADEGLEKTKIRPIVSEIRQTASSSAAEHAFKMVDENPAIVSEIEKQIGNLSDGYEYSQYPILIYDHGAGDYSWGILVGTMKDTEKKNKWVEGKRFLLYELASGEVKYIPVYYPDHLKSRR